MNERRTTSGPQFRSDRLEEQETVRTTVVGGRPPGIGRRLSDIPRGIEVLISKAAVDTDFRRLLLDKREEAADAIGLSLDAAEVLMLKTAPSAHLAAIIDRTKVPAEHRRAFLGTAAAAMLAAIGATVSGCSDRTPVTGSAPDLPRPDPSKDAEGASSDDTDPGAGDPSQVPPATGGDSDGGEPSPVRGVRPDRVPAPQGSRPDVPELPPGNREAPSTD